ncbi:MAG: RICIN domain-containing protein [Clostridia bacterium]|nr:RICIN domain-containing protein [Clostridia bacterium]
MSTIKRTVTIFLAICMAFCFCISADVVMYAKAEGLSIAEGYYIIKGVGSGKYLDVTDESKENGAQLQIWDKFAYHQNQVFYLAPAGNYYRIISCNSNKVIEVRDSRMDNGAPVAQWDNANIACQQWSIIDNGDGTVSFKNRNSGKYMDVSGNETTNGTKIIQYESNGSLAQKFEIKKLHNEDVHSASWSMDMSQIRTQWVPIFGRVHNLSGYDFTAKNGLIEVPVADNTYLVKIEYIDANTVLDIICEKGMDSSTLNQLGDLVKGEATEEAVGAILKKAGWEVPGVGIIIGTAQILFSLTDKSSEEYKSFVNAARQGKTSGSVNGVIRKTYVTFNGVSVFGPLNDGTTAWGTYTDILAEKRHEYSVWESASQLQSPKGSSGNWNYTFE